MEEDILHSQLIANSQVLAQLKFAWPSTEELDLNSGTAMEPVFLQTGVTRRVQHPIPLPAPDPGITAMTNQRPEPKPIDPADVEIRYDTTPDPIATRTLAVLRQAVGEALDRKRRLGQYAVFWQNGQVVRVEAKDLPALP